MILTVIPLLLPVLTSMINRDKFPTGDDDLVGFVTVTLTVPDSAWILRVLQGTLLIPADVDSWFELGTASKELAEQTFIDIYNSIEIT